MSIIGFVLTFHLFAGGGNFDCRVQNPDTLKSAAKTKEKITVFDSGEGDPISHPKTSTGKNSFLAEYAKNAPESWKESIQMLADSLVKPAGNEMEKALVLFDWVALNMEYDSKTHETSDFNTQTALDMIKGRKAMCGGYSCILAELCQAAGIEAKRIRGLDKGYRFLNGTPIEDSHHAWNVIKIDGKWRLCDVTWASGIKFRKDGKEYSIPGVNDQLFDVDPRIFIFGHFPDSAGWQLLAQPINFEQFKKLPYLSSELLKLDFDAGSLLTAALKNEISEFVKVNYVSTAVDEMNVPVSKWLKLHKPVSFIIRSDKIEKIYIQDDTKWWEMHRLDDTFFTSFSPHFSKFQIWVKPFNTNKTNMFLEYKTEIR
jgi:transglutaminase/protease-like cytokinesis protein 3